MHCPEHLTLQHTAAQPSSLPNQLVHMATASPTLPLLKAQNWHLYVQILQ